MRTVYADMRCVCGAVQRFQASAVIIVDGKEVDAGLDQVAERAKAEFRERHVTKLEETVAMLSEQLANVAAAARVDPATVARKFAEDLKGRPPKPPTPPQAPIVTTKMNGKRADVVIVDDPLKAQADEPTAYERSLLAVLAAHHPRMLTRAQLSFLSGKSHRSSSFEVAISSLKQAGLVCQGGQSLGTTSAGITAAGDYSELPRGAELFAYWKGKVKPYAAALLEVAYDEYPREIVREDLAEVSGKSSNSSSFEGAISLLCQFDILEKRAGAVRVTDAFADAVGPK